MSTELPQDPVALVRHFLGEMQQRNLDAARDCLHPDFAMTFPGNATFSRLEELVEWARPRYQDIGKHIERCEAAAPESGRDVVWCFGTLYGHWPSGDAFDGIRFVDRFTISGGLLITQQVWNDLAETVSQLAEKNTP